MKVIYSPLWQVIGLILFAAVMFGSAYSLYLIRAKDDDY